MLESFLIFLIQNTLHLSMRDDDHRSLGILGLVTGELLKHYLYIIYLHYVQQVPLSYY